MPTFVAFLRAVNVGKRTYPMAELRAAVEAAGFADVATHIQTGNLRVTTPMRSRDRVAAELERVFEADRGFAVPTIVFTRAEIEQVVADAEELPPPEVAHYVELLRAEPGAAGAKLIEGLERDRERFVVRGRAVHMLYDRAFHEAKGLNAAAQKAAGDGTNRNLKVLRAILEKWA
ncbi:DUF1697 domain-containing protein [Nocardioides mangrovicus]|uniref:DUF1697 domain-containing protein n=1 Tax=Nocardioides mangrovicus TaxID=2478913 RepID=A0A3L8P437_9ACTN|nr:DUF1697 domain-containing protein [Nocardioides mangrovicus]RLV49797.1 DUF1697 domain-containing protein [Nocardioides mangrovicus]